MRRLLVAIGVVSLTIAMAACGDADELNNETAVPVSRAEFGDQWPFTVESGLADCFHINRVPLFIHGEDRYKLTGTGRAFGFVDLNPIRLDDPDNPGEKMSFEPIVEVALAQCDITKLRGSGGPG